jgi:hypothetical protein
VVSIRVVLRLMPTSPSSREHATGETDEDELPSLCYLRTLAEGDEFTMNLTYFLGYFDPEPPRNVSIYTPAKTTRYMLVS